MCAFIQVSKVLDQVRIPPRPYIALTFIFILLGGGPRYLETQIESRLKIETLERCQAKTIGYQKKKKKEACNIKVSLRKILINITDGHRGPN